MYTHNGKEYSTYADAVKAAQETAAATGKTQHVKWNFGYAEVERFGVTKNHICEGE